jgi:predicted NAD/FAD-binding protein
MRIAVIGTGIAGNAAARALSKRCPVSNCECELRPGGHSHTVTIDGDERLSRSISASRNQPIYRHRRIRGCCAM